MSCAETAKAVQDLAASVKIMLPDAETRVKKLEADVANYLKNADVSLKYLHPKTIDLLDAKFSDQLFYPVMLPLIAGQENRIVVEKNYAANNRTAGSGGVAGVNLSLLVGGGSWGGNSMHIMVLHNNQTYRPTVPALGFMQHGYQLGLFLRGGHKYTIRSSNPSDDIKLLAERTEYYINDDPQYNLTAGPVDLAKASASTGALGQRSELHAHHFYINELGKTL